MIPSTAGHGVLLGEGKLGNAQGRANITQAAVWDGKQTPFPKKRSCAHPDTPAPSKLPRQVESLPIRSTFALPPVYLQTVSRTLELSLQSSLQLSLTVLVCYRSRGKYLALGGVYHPLWTALSSNPTPRKMSYAPRSGDSALPNRPCTLNGRWPQSGGLGH